MACGGNIPLWPFILVHIWLSVWGFEATVAYTQWVSQSYAWMNFSICALGCWTIGQQKKENCLMLIISLIIGFIFDIVFLSLYKGNLYCVDLYESCSSPERSHFFWSYVTAIINCLFKLVTVVFAICEYKRRGGKTPNIEASVSVS
ncbi:type-1 angiotensin II receptor-associated protein-like [Saccoglossus kowalevskii]